LVRALLLREQRESSGFAVQNGEHAAGEYERQNRGRFYAQRDGDEGRDSVYVGYRPREQS
jgi:hypothetical protein